MPRTQEPKQKRGWFRVYCLTFILVATLGTVGTSFASPQIDVFEKPDRMLDIVRPKAPIIVINIWATWCQPCVEEMPEFVELDRVFSDDRVQFIGVSIDDIRPGTREDEILLVERFLERLEVEYPNLFFIGDPAYLYGYFRTPNSLPLTLILDSTGVILDKFETGINAEELASELRALLGE